MVKHFVWTKLWRLDYYVAPPCCTFSHSLFIGPLLIRWGKHKRELLELDAMLRRLLAIEAWQLKHG